MSVPWFKRHLNPGQLPWLERHKFVATGKYTAEGTSYSLEFSPAQRGYPPSVSLRIGRRWIWIQSRGCSVLALAATIAVMSYLVRWYWP